MVCTSETENIRKMQKYIEELYKKGIKDLDNYNGMVTHLEPDILEYEVKWVLGSVTTHNACGGYSSFH